MKTTSRTIWSFGIGGALLTMATIAVSMACNAAPTMPRDSQNYRKVAAEVADNFQHQVLERWYPRAVDTEHGGFYENFDESWARPAGDPNLKSIVYQSRLTWVAAEAARRDPARAAAYGGYARQGLAFLTDKLWDKDFGGMYWQVDQNGQPQRNAEKHVYGISFAIYAASAVYHATKDPAALDLGKRAFLWLEKYSHDNANGGYYEALTRDGTPILKPSAEERGAANDAIGTRYGYKSMNTHIHLLESFTALYEVWPDPLLHKRLQEVFGIVRDRIVVASVGCMNLFFTPDWHAVPDHDSFGHDVETAYLLTESSAVLGKPDDEKTWAAARSLVDHALAFGWDGRNGGFYDTGSAFGAPTGLDKVWWTQAEGLNALLLMSERYDGADSRYWDAFLQQWEFIQQHQIDAKNGGWLRSVSPAGAPIPGASKSDAWTEAYHQGRALMNVEERLRHMADKGSTTH